jgi:trk system potassium uptake protein TrkA
MYIIVVGAGKVGYYLVKTLISEGHEVLLIEKDKRTAGFIAEELGEVVLTETDAKSAH